jgi:hypothetical protein
MVVIMNNPPAFPTSHEEPDDYNGHNNSKKTVIDQGMTLRDYFAAKAMQGMFANPDDGHENYDLSYEDYVKEIARCSYKMADAMLAARE